jgi:hypothetical protein
VLPPSAEVVVSPSPVSAWASEEGSESAPASMAAPELLPDAPEAAPEVPPLDTPDVPPSEPPEVLPLPEETVVPEDVPEVVPEPLGELLLELQPTPNAKAKGKSR